MDQDPEKRALEQELNETVADLVPVTEWLREMGEALTSQTGLVRP